MCLNQKHLDELGCAYVGQWRPVNLIKLRPKLGLGPFGALLVLSSVYFQSIWMTVPGLTVYMPCIIFWVWFCSFVFCVPISVAHFVAKVCVADHFFFFCGLSLWPVGPQGGCHLVVVVGPVAMCVLHCVCFTVCALQYTVHLCGLWWLLCPIYVWSWPLCIRIDCLPWGKLLPPVLVFSISLYVCVSPPSDGWNDYYLIVL